MAQQFNSWCATKIFYHYFSILFSSHFNLVCCFVSQAGSPAERDAFVANITALLSMPSQDSQTVFNRYSSRVALTGPASNAIAADYDDPRGVHASTARTPSAGGSTRLSTSSYAEGLLSSEGQMCANCGVRYLHTHYCPLSRETVAASTIVVQCGYCGLYFDIGSRHADTCVLKDKPHMWVNAPGAGGTWRVLWCVLTDRTKLMYRVIGGRL